MTYFVPNSLEHAVAFLAQEDAKVLAGGTDFFPSLGDSPVPPKIIDVSRVPELLGITETAEGWQIGSSVTWSQIVNTPFPPCFDALKLAAKEVGSWQIQNAGTIAGNLCNASPAADGVPPLLALEARMVLKSRDGTRVLPLSEFLIGPRQTALQQGELVSAIRIPHLPHRAMSHFVKIGARKYMIISIAMVAVVLVCDDDNRIESARIAIGSCSATAKRLNTLEAALIGRTEQEITKAGDFWLEHLDPIAPITDMRATDTYRTQAASELCKRAVLAVLSNGACDG